MDRIPNQSWRVLLIEDGEADAALVSRYLSRSEHPVFELVTVTTLDEGLRRLARGFDVVLLDLLLPDSEGEDTLLKLRSAAPDTPVVVLSALQDNEVARRCIRWGASAFLNKSGLGQDALCSALRGTIERHAR